MSDDLKYGHPPQMSRQELEEAFQSDDGERIGSALIGALCTESGSWILDWCLKLVGHNDGIARYSTALALGAIAMKPESEVDLSKCREGAEKLCGDPDEAVRAAAREALEDVIYAAKLKGVSLS
jgi:hypothetical protein